MRQIELRLRAVNDGLAKCDRKADCRVVDLIVVRKVVDEPAKIVGIQPEFLKKALVKPSFVVVSFRRLNGQLERDGDSRPAAAVELESRMFSNEGV